MTKEEFVTPPPVVSVSRSPSSFYVTNYFFFQHSVYFTYTSVLDTVRTSRYYLLSTDRTDNLEENRRYLETGSAVVYIYWNEDWKFVARRMDVQTSRHK